MRTNNLSSSFLLEGSSNEAAVLAELMIKMNGYISIEAAESLTTLDKTTQYRERLKGKFPKPEEITSSGRRKAYRVNDLMAWLNGEVMTSDR